MLMGRFRAVGVGDRGGGEGVGARLKRELGVRVGSKSS